MVSLNKERFQERSFKLDFGLEKSGALLVLLLLTIFNRAPHSQESKIHNRLSESQSKMTFMVLACLQPHRNGLSGVPPIHMSG